jgi:hypothetical protein
MPNPRHEGSHAAMPFPSCFVHNAVIFDNIYACEQFKKMFNKPFEFVLYQSFKRFWFGYGLMPDAPGGHVSVT